MSQTIHMSGSSKGLLILCGKHIRIGTGKHGRVGFNEMHRVTCRECRKIVAAENARHPDTFIANEEVSP